MLRASTMLIMKAIQVVNLVLQCRAVYDHRHDRHAGAWGLLRDCHPPSVFSFVPKRGSLASAVWCRMLWCAHVVSFYTRDWCWKALSTLYIGWRLPRALRRQLAALRKASRLRGRFAEYGWRYRLPEIILCSEAFDFPRQARRTMLYAGAAIELRCAGPRHVV